MQLSKNLNYNNNESRLSAYKSDHSTETTLVRITNMLISIDQDNKL